MNDLNSYMEAAEKVKPWSLKMFPEAFWINYCTGALNYKDSMILETQMLARDAVKTIAGKKPQRVLYVACSYGLGMKLIELEGHDITGIDLDQRAVKFCQSQGLDARIMNAGNLEFDNETFDIVVSRDFVCRDYLPQSVPNKIPWLNEQYRVLKKGGWAVFTTMNDMIRTGDMGLPDVDDLQASKFDSKGMTYQVNLKDKKDPYLAQVRKVRK